MLLFRKISEQWTNELHKEKYKKRIFSKLRKTNDLKSLLIVHIFFPSDSERTISESTTY